MLGEIGAVTAGLMGAVAFGAGDFAGSQGSLRLNGVAAVGVAQLVAAATAVAVLGASGGSIPEGQQLVLALLAGTFHVIAVFYIYQGMARGMVSVVAPVAGVTGIALPVLADMLFFEMSGLIHCIGIALAIAAIVLISQSPAQDNERSQVRFSIRFGLISGLCFGLADLFLGLMTPATAEGGLAAARLMGASLAIGLLGVSTRGTARITASPGSISPLVTTGPARHFGFPDLAGHVSQALSLQHLDNRALQGLLLCALAGLLDCIGQLGYVLSATQGQMSIAAALVAIYPAVSIGLAVWLLKERIGPLQLTGLAASFGSIVLLSQ